MNPTFDRTKSDKYKREQAAIANAQWNERARWWDIFATLKRSFGPFGKARVVRPSDKTMEWVDLYKRMTR